MYWASFLLNLCISENIQAMRDRLKELKQENVNIEELHTKLSSQKQEVQNELNKNDAESLIKKNLHAR